MVNPLQAASWLSLKQATPPCKETTNTLRMGMSLLNRPTKKMKTTKIIVLIGTLLLSTQNSHCEENNNDILKCGTTPKNLAFVIPKPDAPLARTPLPTTQNNSRAKHTHGWQDEGQLEFLSKHVIYMYEIVGDLLHTIQKKQEKDPEARNALQTSDRRRLSRCMRYLHNCAPRNLQCEVLLCELAACTRSIVDAPLTAQDLGEMMEFALYSLKKVHMLIQKQLAQFQETDKSAMPEDQSLAQQIAAEVSGQKHPRQNADAIKEKGEDTRIEIELHGSEGQRKVR